MAFPLLLGLGVLSKLLDVVKTAQANREADHDGELERMIREAIAEEQTRMVEETMHGPFDDKPTMTKEEVRIELENDLKDYKGAVE